MASTHEFLDRIRAAASIDAKEAGQLFDAIWQTIGRELSVGEEVDVPGLGRFLTEKEPGGRHTENGEEHVTLPSIELVFEPASVIIDTIVKAQKERPDLFAHSHDDDDDEHATEEIEKKEAGTSDSNQESLEGVADKKPIKDERPLGRASNIQFREFIGKKIDRAILQLVPQPIAVQYSAAPVELVDNVLTVAMIDPEDFEAVQIIRKQTGLTVNPVLTSKDDIAYILDQYTGLQAELQELVDSADLGISEKELAEAEKEVAGENFEEDAPTARIVSSVLRRAVKERASDIHIEPYEHKLVVRFRLDGVLVTRVELPKEIQAAIIARLKIISTLKIDEQRLPQDGRFSLTVDNREVDFRLSTIPVVFGEKVVMRILDKQFGIRQLGEVGLMDKGLESINKNIERSHGMILVTGPTGSGKTTTLYAVLGKLMGPEVNVITLEDPVEYRIESINQSQVHTDIGYTFAAGLRSVVRQDPDIVMLGEIRDRETADMAIHAALTGHIVLSTLHTNDAAGAFPRLIDMGIEPFLITSSIHTVVAQRLVRILDPEHRSERKLTGSELDEVLEEIEKLPDSTRKMLQDEGIDLKHPTFYEPVVDLANGIKGFKGRMGVFEVLDVTEKIRDLVAQRSSGEKITEVAIKENEMLTMLQDGLVKAMRGMTTLEEVWRVTKE